MRNHLGWTAAAHARRGRVVLLAATAWWALAIAWTGGAASASEATNGLILFSAFPAGNAGSQLYTVDPASGTVVDVSGDSVGDDQGRFSPDGRSIAFRHGNEIWTMKANGSARKAITHIAGGASWPAWSPDGKELTFAAVADGQTGADIWTASASDGSAPLQLTRHHAEDQPTWSPDGKWIAYASNRGGSDDIFRIPSDGSASGTNLTRSSYQDIQPAWSPDSTRILFTSNRPHSGAIGIDLFTMSATGGAPTELDHTTAYGDGQNGAYAPDGTTIAFSANNGTGGLQVWTVPAGGGANSQLTHLPGNPGVNSIDWQHKPSPK